MNSNSVACPLDCFDACEAIYENGKCKPNKQHPVTQSKLCKNFAYLLNETRLEEAYFAQEKVSLEASLTLLTKKLKDVDSSKVLYYKGSGNLGVMQSAPKTFFGTYGATFTRGGLCDEIGSVGLENGRGGFNVNPPLQNLIDSDVIVVWGRNLSVTSSHMYELVKDKTFITIDPICTAIAKKSDVHLQLNPKTDHELALLMTRFAYMNDMEDEENFSEFSEGHDWFFDLAKGRPLVSYENTTGVSLNDVTQALDLMKDKKISFLVGLGVQKYYEGVQIMRTIDSLATYLGVHNKEAGGVWYLGDSSYGYEKQLSSSAKRKVDIATVDFSQYEVVFIQGANPVVSAPNTQHIINGLKDTFVVYFGTTFNDTCEYADLIIPATNFLAKSDVRLSYGHEYKAISHAVETKHENTITEYELAQYLNDSFGFELLKSEDEILDYYINTKPEVPEKIDSFEFIEDLEIDALYEQKKQNEYYFITAKQSDCLNSQFKVDNSIHLHSNLGFKNGDEVILKSSYGQATFTVTLNDDVKDNSVLVYAGAKNVNYVTPLKSDEETYSAIYQEVLVTVELS